MNPLKELITRRGLCNRSAGEQIGQYMPDGKPLHWETVRRWSLSASDDAARHPGRDEVRALRRWSQGRIKDAYWQQRFEQANPLKRAA